MTHAAVPRLRVALGEYDTAWHDPVLSLARADTLARNAAAAGASLVVLPEMCTTGFTMDVSVQPRALDDPQISALAALARTNHVHLIAGVGMRDGARGNDAFSNLALVFDAEGRLVAEYSKQRLFDYAGESKSYRAGDDSVVVNIGGVRIAPFICFDLRFPELFQRVAGEVDACVVIANWPYTRQTHWDTLTRARAIESQCYLIGVNRIGDADGLTYTGGSVAYDPMGTRIDASDDVAHVRIADITAADVQAVRERFPFYAGRR